jgi:hypothetical protein
MKTQPGNVDLSATSEPLAASIIIQGLAVSRLPVPSRTEAAFTPSLWFGHGAALEIEGSRLDVLLPTDPRIIERLSC